MTTLARWAQSNANHTSQSSQTSHAASSAAARNRNARLPSYPLEPLQAMADRVGKEVEKFAERVDRWHTHAHGDAKAKYQDTVKMVGSFRDIAESTVKELKRRHDLDDRGELDQSVRRRIHGMADAPNAPNASLLGRSFQSVIPSIEPSSAPDSSRVHELRQWQAELATWELAQVLIDNFLPEPGTDVAAEKRARLTEVGGALRYSPNIEIWDRFLLEDDPAKEKEVVLRWLEQTARNSESDIESITQQLESESGIDTNMWTSGWLETRMRLKHAKRLQGEEGVLSPDTTNLMSKADTQPLVTQLDPDAPSRQRRVLEKGDGFYERAVWMVCYEMLRRGSTWEEVSEWCKARNEAWRGVSLGAANDTPSEGGPNVAGPTVGYLFRRMCFYAARGTQIPYESAVYGLLSGDLKHVQAVARNWDDHLYAQCNALLLSRFDDYLQRNYSHRVPEAMTRRFQDAAANLDDWPTSTGSVIRLLKQEKSTAAQALTPMKLIQGSLISRSVDELVFKVGTAIAIMLQEDDRPGNLILDPESDPMAPGPKSIKPQRTLTAEKYHHTLATDPHALRLLVHIFIILRKGLNQFSMDAFPQMVAMDNVIIAYIEFLRTSKRLQIIPLYAAQLEATRTIHCLGRILPQIKSGEEQERYIALMEQYRINVVDVLAMNCHISLDISGMCRMTDSDDKTIDPRRISKFELLEKVGVAEDLWPGQRVKLKFAGQDITPQEDAVIESARWYSHDVRDAEMTFVALNQALSSFLLNGRIGAAEKLVKEMPTETVCLERTKTLCGYAFDIKQENANVQDANQIAQLKREAESKSGRSPVRPLNIPSATEHAQWVKQLSDVSYTYGEMQQITRSITLCRQWREEEDNIIRQTRQGVVKPSTKRLKELLEAITATLEPLLLTCMQETPPLADFIDIKRLFLPELTLAYITILYSAAFITGRDSATKALDFATLVATYERVALRTLLIDTGTLSKLVDLFGAVSKATLKLNEAGEAKRGVSKKRGSRGETLQIWDLNVAGR
ncbi:nuclear pore complex protein-like protein Nup107 [Massariosphaeria phaeospora]|uniref:Nuclear pore complex protein n=1 Tax=Massariosphaeria phaeospora TaxID=100035 RepID=A0A7C8MN81_9PLEO|nr:nuclear pore complex protein-like protein Nup107 [Massariosphaeria phaeospora]